MYVDPERLCSVISKFSNSLTYNTTISYWPSGGGAFSNIYEPGKLSVAATDVGENPIPSLIHLQCQMGCKRAIYICRVFPIFVHRNRCEPCRSLVHTTRTSIRYVIRFRTAVWKCYISSLYQGLTNYGRQVCVAPKFCTVAPISCGFTV
jgi:hypothetical protein